MLESRKKLGSWLKLPCLTELQALHFLCVINPGIRLTTEERVTDKPFVRAVRKCPLVTIHCGYMATLSGVGSTSLSIPVSLRTL